MKSAFSDSGAPHSDQRAPADHPTVLVIEDNADHAEMVRVMLAHARGPRWTVASADTLAEARAWLERNHADVVLLDLNLPDSQGPVTARLLCGERPGLPVVVCTSLTDEAVAFEAMHNGAQDHLVKGEFEGALLSRTLRLAIERKRSRDVTEVLRSREALQERERTFRLLFEQNPQPMWVFDWETTRFLEVNEAAVEHYGYSREEFLGMSLADIRPREDLPLLEAHLGGPPSGPSARGTWRHLTKDGRVIEVEVTGHDIEFAGRPSRLIVSHDVTHRNQIQAQQVQSQKMEAIGRLAGGIAHDFNNLLGVITGYVGLLMRDLPEGRPRHRAAEVIKAADRASALTRQLLTFSRTQVSQPRVLDLNAVVAEMGEMLRRLVGEDVQLVTRCGQDLGRVRADPSQVEQVLLNLVVNARDAMPQGGRLLVETANLDLDAPYAATHAAVPAGRYVMLAASDTGTGMTPDVVARIFEPFFTTKASGKGTGLGLATVYGIVKQSGGQIFVYSEPGHGTTFKVYLPRIDGPADAAASGQATAARGGHETVLLVEDDGSLRDVIREMLQEKGYTVLAAPNVAQALEIGGRVGSPVDLVLTDMVLPDRSGRALADELRRKAPSTKVVFMSGYTDDKVTQDGALLPGQHFIEKPFDQESLVRKVRAVLDEA